MAAPCGKHRRHAQIAALRMLQALLDLPQRSPCPMQARAQPGLVSSTRAAACWQSWTSYFGKPTTWPRLRA